MENYKEDQLYLKILGKLLFFLLHFHGRIFYIFYLKSYISQIEELDLTRSHIWYSR